MSEQDDISMIVKDIVAGAPRNGIMKTHGARIVRNALIDSRQAIKHDINLVPTRDWSSQMKIDTLKRLHFDLDLINLMLIELSQDGTLQMENYS